MATLLNILGLSVAFAAFIVILMQLDYDYNFDRMHENSDRIYRVEIVHNRGAQVVVSRPLSDRFIKSSPHILAGTIVNPWHGKAFFTIEKNGLRNNYEERVLLVYPEYTDVFKFDMIEGTERVLEDPEKILIPQSMAKKFYGNATAIGETIKNNETNYTIGGVYRDFPSNSIVLNAIYRPFPKDENTQNWGNNNYELYVRVDSPENSALLVENFKKNFDVSALGSENAWVKEINLRMTLLTDVHFTTDTQYDRAPKSTRQTLLVLLSIAIIIVIIAGINFTNFSTALAPMRIKSINTQKVLGGEESVIRFSLISEALCTAVFAFILALGFVYILQFTYFISLINADITLASHPLIVLVTAFLAIITGIIAGLYPAYYMTSFSPALVLKGSFGLSPKGRKLRSVLISVQFIASFALIIGSFFMYLQNRYMQNTPLGFDKDQLIITNINGNINKNRETFANQVKSFSGIADITFAEQLLSSQDQYMGWGRKYRDGDISFQCLPVDPSFMKVMGIEVIEGRHFREEDKNSQNGVLIFNQKARDQYDLTLGDKIENIEIIGVMPDVKFASFRMEVIPMAFFVWGTENWGSQPNFAYIKVNAGSDLRGAMEHVRTSLKTFDSEYPYDVRFFDEVLNRVYEKERNLTSLITLFSLIAIFISIVGVFGLVVFDSEYKKKEIGLRKVLGSTTQQILILFNKLYVRILCICFILSAPVAWYAVDKWLENFAYKTPMYWWVYPTAFFIVFIITICTVTFQNWRAANENPVNSIKNE